MDNLSVVVSPDADHQAFIKFMAHVTQVNGSIGSDQGEWQALSDICSASTNIHDYTQRCQGLWTTGEDQSSWSTVMNAASTAGSQPDHDALVTVLTGFQGITDPSHNSDQWSDLRQFAGGLLDLIQPDPFKSMMRLVVTLASGISTDTGEWARYSDICGDSANSGIGTYISRCGELWTAGLDQSSWTAVQDAARAATGQSDHNALVTILFGYLAINSPSHNADQWAALKQNALAIFSSDSFNLFVDDSAVTFTGTDTRGRRIMADPDQLPEAMSMSYLIRKDDFPAHYTEIAGYKACHVEYLMRLDQSDPEGSAFFVVTHSQDNGGYVGLAKVPGGNVGPASIDNKITVAEPGFAGDMVWYDHLDASHPGGCNHPGNGGQIGSKVVLVGQDWTKTYPFIGHAVVPVGHGSKILFYDFAMLESCSLPSMRNGTVPSNAYLGCITTEQLNIAPGDDGEVSTVLIEQGPDGSFYLIAANRNQTVLWSSPELVPDISKWKQLPIWSVNSMEDGSAMLAWTIFGGSRPALYYVKSRDNGMDFRPLKYQVENGEVLSVFVDGTVSHQTTQSSDFMGSGGWVEDNGSLYPAAGGAFAMHGAYQSVDDSKGPPGQEVPCIQVRTWYSN